MSDSRTAAVVASLTPPIPHSYWVEPERLLAGEYPSADDGPDTRRRLAQILAAGITYFLDLTQPDELPPYDNFLPPRAAT
ncbi:MAG: hypothetical protein ACRET4_15055, partial [Steroidobacteraceae bacterium]